MKTYFFLKKTLEELGKFSSVSGSIKVRDILPIHTFSENMSYVVMANGVLTSFFSLKKYDRIQFLSLYKYFPYNGCIQVYKHCEKDGSEPNLYLALSNKIEYFPEFPFWKTVLSSFTNSIIKKGMEELEAETDSSYSSIQKVIEPLINNGVAQHLSSFSPLVKKIASVELTEHGYKIKGKPFYNVSYLKLANNKYGLIIELSSWLPLANKIYIEEPKDIEYLSYTSLYYPSSKESNRDNIISSDYLNFQSHFQKKTTGDRENSFLTQNITDTMMLKINSQNILANHFYFLISESVSELTQKANEFIRNMSLSGHSLNASITKTYENYCFLFPGNYSIKKDGNIISPSVVSGLMARLYA